MTKQYIDYCVTPLAIACSVRCDKQLEKLLALAALAMPHKLGSIAEAFQASEFAKSILELEVEERDALCLGALGLCR